MDFVTGQVDQAQPVGDVQQQQVMHEPAPEQPAEQPLADNQVKLSDGRIVEMREQLGNDEMIVAAQLGKVFTADGAGAVVFQSCLIARCITSIDGKPVAPMRSFEAYRDFLAQFKGKDLNRLKKLYEKLNGDGGEEGNA